MSQETYPEGITTEQLERFSTPAVLALRDRRSEGNGSAYDFFLCNYVGDPEKHMFHPIDRVAPSGRTYAYNSPHPGEVRSSFTPSGIFVNIRRAQNWGPAWRPIDSDDLKQSLRSPEDDLAEFFVASADLRTGSITEWRVVGIERYGQYGKENVKLHLSDQPGLASVDGPVESSDPLEALIARRLQTTPAVTAQVRLDAASGCWFKQDGLPEEPLISAEHLITEVNELTALDGFTGTRLDELREQAAHTLARVVPIRVA